MSEDRPEYKLGRDVLDQAMLEQMLSIHQKYDEHRKKPGEFTVKEYKDMVNRNSDQGMGSDRARAELEMGERDGIIARRKIGGKIYWRFVK